MEIDPLFGDVEDSSNSATEEEEADYHLGYNPQLNCGYDEKLGHDRRQNKAKLRSRFAHIFKKYGQDFEGIGDEIDLKSGEIVVDNGHLSNMRYEFDIGDNTSLENTETDYPDLQQIGDEDHIEQSDGNGAADESGVGEEDSEDEDSADERNSNGDFSVHGMDVDSATSLFDAEESAREHPVDDPDIILKQMPDLRESMLTLQSQYRSGQTVDPDAIQALGMSIANQLANFMSRDNKHKPKQGSKISEDPVQRYRELPGEQREKRRQRSPSPPPVAADLSPSSKSLWAPLRVPRQQKRRKMNEMPPLQQRQGEEEDGDASPVIAEPYVYSHYAPNTHKDGTQRQCTNCGSSDSHIWRNGPDGELCNTCGMYYYRYGLIRPLEPFSETDEPVTPNDTDTDADPLAWDWLDWGSSHSTGSKKKEKERLKPIGAKHSMFVVEEDAMIIKLKEIDLLSWERIARYFPGRSAYSLQCRYSKKLRGRAREARNLLVEQGYQGTEGTDGIVQFSYTRDPFKNEEDELLLKLREEDKLDWEQVAASIPGRSPEVLELRYEELARIYLGEDVMKPKRRKATKPKSKESSFPQSVRVRYSAEEDMEIVRLREVKKLNWVTIANRLTGRNSFTLQKRYIRELCGRHPNSVCTPREAYWRGSGDVYGSATEDEISDGASVKNAKYTSEEDQLLWHSRSVQLMSWEDIMARFPDRSRSSLENRYKYMLEKGYRGAQLDGSRPVDSGSSIVSSNPRAGPPLKNQTSMSQPSKKQQNTNKRWTLKECDLLWALRNQGMHWDEIANRLPGRTAKAAEAQYAAKFGRVKLREILPAPPGPKPQTPLLRQAVDNLRRRSLSAALPPNPYGAVDQSGCGTDSRIEPTVVNEADVHRNQTIGEAAVVPSAMDDEADGRPKTPERPYEEFQGDDHAGLHPETPVNQASAWGAGTLPTPTATYSTPARYNQQGHPYFIAPAATIYSPPRDYQILERIEPMYHTWGIERPDLLSRAPAPTQAFKQKPLSPKVKKMPKHDTARNKEHGQHQDDTDVDDEMMTPKVTDEEIVYDDTTEGTETDGESSFNSRADNEDNESVSSNAMETIPEQGSESEKADSQTDEMSNEQDEQDEQDDGSEYSEHVHPVEQDEPKKLASKTPATQPAPGIPLSEQMERPPFTWVQLLTMALESTAPSPMKVNDICEFLKQKFPYFQDQPSLMNNVRSKLSSQPQFGKPSKTYKSGWVLTDVPALNTVKRGHSRKRRKPGEPPRPRGRPPKNSSSSDKPTENSTPDNISRLELSYSEVGLSSISDEELRRRTQSLAKEAERRELRSATRCESPVSSGYHELVASNNSQGFTIVENTSSVLHSDLRPPEDPSNISQPPEDRELNTAVSCQATFETTFPTTEDESGVGDQDMQVEDTASSGQEMVSSAGSSSAPAQHSVPSEERQLDDVPSFGPEALNSEIALPALDDKSVSSGQQMEIEDDSSTNNAVPESDLPDRSIDQEVISAELQQAVISDTNKDPESSDEMVGQDSSEISIDVDEGALSSSPVLTRKVSPAIVYGKAATPATGASTLFSRSQKRDSFGFRSTPISNGRSASLQLGSRKRVVCTPMRQCDSSEDELAL